MKLCCMLYKQLIVKYNMLYSYTCTLDCMQSTKQRNCLNNSSRKSTEVKGQQSCILCMHTVKGTSTECIGALPLAMK